MPIHPSRQRFDDYRETVARRHRGGKNNESAKTEDAELQRSKKKIGDRERSFLELFREFWRLIAGHRSTVIVDDVEFLLDAQRSLAVEHILRSRRHRFASWIGSG